MPFAFAQIDGRTGGVLTDNAQVGYGSYLRARWNQGLYDGLFNQVRRLEEWRIADGGKTLTRDEANEKYALPGLNFNEEINEERAHLLHERHRKMMEREYFLTTGHRNWRGAAGGFITQMAASMLNPIDIGLSFVPITRVAQVGRTASRAKLAYTGLRGAVNRGYINLPESIGKYTATHALVNNAIFQSAAEAPRYLEMKVTGYEDYTILHSLANVAGGTVLGTGIHLGVVKALDMFKRLKPRTRELMHEQQVNRFLDDRPQSGAENIASLDRNIIRDVLVFDEVEARKAAGLEVDKMMQEIHDAVLESYMGKAGRSQQWWQQMALKIARKSGFNKFTDKIAKVLVRSEGDLKVIDDARLALLKQGKDETKKLMQQLQDLSKLSLTEAKEALKDLGVRSKHRGALVKGDISPERVATTTEELAQIKEILGKIKKGRKKSKKTESEIMEELNAWTYSTQVLSEIHQFARGAGSQANFLGDFKPRFTEEGKLKPEFADKRRMELLSHPEIEKKVDAEIQRRAEAIIEAERINFLAEKRNREINGPEAEGPRETQVSNERDARIKEPPKDSMEEDVQTERVTQQEIDDLTKELAEQYDMSKAEVTRQIKELDVDEAALDQAFSCVAKNLL